MPQCPECGRPLSIEGLPTMTAGDFMALPFRVSSAARWVCDEHGVMRGVVVSVVDDRVEFVDPAGSDGPT